MKIRLASVFVKDQADALAFYTGTLGFEVKEDFPVGEHRWLTVVSPEESDGAELLLEPNENPAAGAYQESLFEQGIAAVTFSSNDIETEYVRLRSLGVEFTLAPTDVGNAVVAVFDDTCGNLIQLAQMT